MNQARGIFASQKLKEREVQMNTILDSDDKNLTTPDK